MFVTKRQRTHNDRVSRGRSDKEWAELLQFREEMRKEEQEITELRASVYPQLCLRIIYNVQHETHSGYCSDPDDNLEIIHKTCVETVGLPTAFKKRDIYCDGILQSTIPANNALLLRLFSKPSQNCNKGSGFCGCKTTYSIKSTSIFVPVTRHRLDEPIDLSDIA